MGELLSLLYWTMLAACTVGPGTVVTCARAGAEFQLQLVWVLIFASLLAYILQEGTARLTIHSGLSLGQCLRAKYRHTTVKLYDSAIICWVVAVCVTLGNTLYECNNWAGGIDAVMSMPGASDLDISDPADQSALTGVRVGCCIAYAIIVLALLYKDKTDILGIFLGFIMMAMIILFIIVVALMGTDWNKFAWGLVPNYPGKTEVSAEPADIIVSLVGTTSIGFNLFLGGAMAQGKKLRSAQRGIAFSTLSAFVVSVLILIVGAGYHDEKYPDTSSSSNTTTTSGLETGGSSKRFSITDLASFLTQYVGQGGVAVYSVGFIAAALSSMLTVPLGAALTADSVFSDSESSKAGADNPNFEDDDPKKNTEPAKTSSGLQSEEELEGRGQKLPRKIYLGIMFVMVIIATLVISANADRTYVILVAQVFNGCLLPFFSTLLLLCLNDEQFMAERPQPMWANLLLMLSVLITMFLANNAIIQKIFGSLLTCEACVTIRLAAACGAAVLEMCCVIIFTSLRRDLSRSIKQSRLGRAVFEKSLPISN